MISRCVLQDASVVNDFGAAETHNPGEAEALLRAKLLGVKVETKPHDSYEVENPFDKPAGAEAFLLSMFEQLIGGRSDGASQGRGDMLPGRNSLLMRAWME